MRYANLSHEEKQRIAEKYPYLSDDEIFKQENIESSYDMTDFKNKYEEEYMVPLEKDEAYFPDMGNYGYLDIALKGAPPDIQEAAIGIAKTDASPEDVLKQLVAIETVRLKQGIEYEQELGLGLEQDTQACINSITNISRILNQIKEGDKLSVSFNNTLTQVIANTELDKEDIIKKD